MKAWDRVRSLFRRRDSLEPLHIEVIPLGNAVGLQISRGEEVYVSALLPQGSARKLAEHLMEAACPPISSSAGGLGERGH